MIIQTLIAGIKRMSFSLLSPERQNHSLQNSKRLRIFDIYQGKKPKQRKVITKTTQTVQIVWYNKVYVTYTHVHVRVKYCNNVMFTFENFEKQSQENRFIHSSYS